MSNGTPVPPLQQLPLNWSIAPFPEGFEGDMDEHAQQLIQLTSAWVEGNFLTGLVLPQGSTLPTSNVGPVAIGTSWYFWDATAGQYVPATQSIKVAQNYVKNCVYQIQQTGATFSLGPGNTKIYDLAIARSPAGTVLAVSSDVGPLASAASDYIPTAIKYVVGPSLVPAPGASDVYAHEHLVEGSDLVPLQGQVLSLSLFVWSNVPGTYSVYLTSSGRDCSYVHSFTIPTASTWYQVLVNSIPQIPVGVGTWHFGEGQTGMYIGVAMCVGAQGQTGAPNTWQGGFYAGTSQNMNLLTVVNNTLKITGLKLEGNTSASYVSVPSWEADYQDAIRYYFTSFNYQSTTQGILVPIFAPQAGQWMADMLFPTRMCNVPVVTPYSQINKTSGYITDLSLGSDIAVASIAAQRKGLSDLETSTALTQTGTIGIGTLATTGITGTTTNASTSITALSSTTGLAVNMGVSGTGIPTSTTIVSIAGSTITISAAATASGTVALSFSPTPTGITGNLNNNTNSITSLSSVSGLVIGMGISGAGIPSGSTIVAIASATSITISGLCTAATNGVALSFTPATEYYSVNVTGMASTTGLLAGMTVTGTGIPAGTTIAQVVSATAINLSQAAPPATGVSLSFSAINRHDILGAYITADARLS